MMSIYSLLLAILPVNIATEDIVDDKYTKMLQGSYQVVTLENSGVSESADIISRIEKFTIDGDKISMTLKTKQGPETNHLSIVKIDTGNMPVHIDLKGERGSFKGEVSKGIIIVEEDTIKICCASDAKAARPTKFKTTMDDKSFLIVIKRLPK